MKNKKRILFMGTPKIANIALVELLKIDEFDIVSVVCQPDRKLDRKNNIIFSDVKKTCLEKNIHCLQPEKIIELYNELVGLKIDAIITCAYGQFIPTKILEIPKYGVFNLHGSLLPKLRGGAPIHWAIINSEEKTGWTLMKTILKMDAGDYCSQISVKIDENETTQTLMIKMEESLKQIIKNDIGKIFDQSTNWIKQDESKVTFAYNIKKEDRIINFNNSAKNIKSLVNGLYDIPIAIWKFKDFEIKIFDCIISNNKSNKKVGSISKIDHLGIHISTLDYDVIFNTIQFPNKSKIKISENYKNSTLLKEFN